jgi:predicted MFS family arabinose efflux permease
MRFPPGLRALAHREFRRFYLAQLAAQVGGWIQAVAQSWLVLQLTGSPLRLGLISTLQFAPVLFLSILTGAIADRLPKRRVLLVTQTTYLCQALALTALVASGAARYWHVCVLGFVLGLANALDQPVRQAYIVELVGRNDLGNAIALNSAAFNTARIVGPAAAGVLIARVGLAAAFALNALGFAIVIAALFALRAHGLPAPASGAGVIEEIAAGVRYALRTPVIVVALALLTVVSLFVFNFTVYVPLLASTVLGLGPEGFGFLMAALGVGAVTGALTVGMSREPSLPGMFTTAALAIGGLLWLSTVRQFWTAVPALFVTGFSGIILVASCNTRVQIETPAELRGRVIGLYVLLSGGVFPIGAFMVGAISQRWGVSTAFLCGGLSGSLALIAIGWWWRRHGRR